MQVLLRTASPGNAGLVSRTRCFTLRHAAKMKSNTLQIVRRQESSIPPVRHFSIRPELEHEDDRASERFLRGPCTGGFVRGNFIRDRCGDAIEEKYDFLDSLGKGGMSKVKAACHKKTGRKVAVKIAEKISSECVQALEREVDFLKKTDHPNVVRLFEVYEDADKLCLVLELCRGGDLQDYIRQKHRVGSGFDEAELKDLTKSMLQAVSYCHSHSIVHRDIKPSNFMFAPRLKLVDFGVSGVVPHSHPNTRFLKVKAGTDGYIAPEVLNKRPYGPSADIFSLGATLFHMITGVVPTWLEALGQYHFPKSPKLKRLSADGMHFSSILLAKNPLVRPTAGEALRHPWLTTDSAHNSTHLDDDRVGKLKGYSKLSKLQRAARTNYVVNMKLQEDDLVGLESEFCGIVQSSMGEINYKDLRSSMRLRSSLEAADLLQGLDADGGGTVAFSEYLVASLSTEVYHCEAGARRAFETLDSDGDGYISAKDLGIVLPNVFSEEELLHEMERYDLNADGHLDFEEFCQLLKQERSEALKKEES